VNAHELVEAFWRHANARQWDAFGGLFTDDVVYEVPQTRERVRGAANYVEFNRTWPGDWRAQVLRIVGEGDRGASWIEFRVDGTVATGISFFDLRDGRIARITDWWPEPYEPPARMTDRIERY
jgi:ketosteroid isomerase-like protein